eukprot:6338201-Pyramimonas_sp.AAC.1
MRRLSRSPAAPNSKPNWISGAQSPITSKPRPGIAPSAIRAGRTSTPLVMHCHRWAHVYNNLSCRYTTIL